MMKQILVKNLLDYKKFVLQSLHALILFLAVSCSNIKNIQVSNQLSKNYCNQEKIQTYTPDELPSPIHTLDIDTLLASRFSFQSLNTAHAIGVLDLLKKYMYVKRCFDENPSIENKVEMLELSQKIYHKIHQTSLEISAIAGELDCEEERADQIANFLKNIEDDAETKLTVGAIVIGATGALITGLLLTNGNLGNLGEKIGILSSVTEGILGLLILRNKKKIFFSHPRNPLKDIWEGNKTSEIFPKSIWYFLNYYDPDRPEEPSLRYQIIDRWMSFGQISMDKTKRKRKLIDLYFGLGGLYSAEQLYNRANMLDQLEATINLMQQDLKVLTTEIEFLNF
ncbi:hypothetical protein JCM31826_12320 [Thermaurantimonas aggregans]|uniref:Lipoprotein n=1 Tax=Thermaurantimonas aggregans TaxID=2173829 RepID=A0A401XL85_9FLAO|nr:hypothetical protein [Thermaurantimonas aggregans]GCD77750.1 hypothetical protein JCM31826_12320 [Thermaurantimonas aggregans]